MKVLFYTILYTIILFIISPFDAKYFMLIILFKQHKTSCVFMSLDQPSSYLLRTYHFIQYVKPKIRLQEILLSVGATHDRAFLPSHHFTLRRREWNESFECK